jgi:hypothetical protein
MVGKTIREILQGIPIDISHNEKGYAFNKEKLEAIGTIYGELGRESISLPNQEEIDAAASAIKQRELEQTEASILEQQDREQMQQQLERQQQQLGQTKNTNSEFVKSTILPPIQPTMSTPRTNQKGEEQHNKGFWREDIEGDCEGDA